MAKRQKQKGYLKVSRKKMQFYLERSNNKTDGHFSTKTQDSWKSWNDILKVVLG